MPPPVEPALLFRAAADLVVALHAGFVAFVVLGALLVMRWRRVAWLHLPAAAWGVLVELRGWICPLTPLEMYFRERSGAGVYQGDFVERYVLPLLYPAHLTRALQIRLGVAVIVINVAVYLWILARRPPRRQSPALPDTSMRRRRLLAIAAVVVIAAAAMAVREDVHGLTLLVRAADLQGPLRRLAEIDTVSVREWTIDVSPSRDGMRGRVYAPAGVPRYTAVVIPGLHPSGIDEPRFVALARKLAQSGITVVTVEIPELARFEIVPAATDRIERATVWTAAESGLAPDGRVGLIGVSVSGGLAVVAAGRPSLRHRLRYVLSIGGHDDLPRVLRYLCGAVPADRPPHDYGAAVVLLNVADGVVPPEQVAPLRAAVDRFLRASYLDTVDRAAAAREFQSLRDLAPTMPEPSASLLADLNDRDSARLGVYLLPQIAAYASAPALSPARSPAPAAPVFLLHGREDSVIPASESESLAGRLRGGPPVRLVLTDLISHVDTGRSPRARDVFRVARFWGAVLSQ